MEDPQFKAEYDKKYAEFMVREANLKAPRLHYKGHVGTHCFDPENQIYYGQVEGSHTLISYESATAEGLPQAFEEAVDDYLAMCSELGLQPWDTHQPQNLLTQDEFELIEEVLADYFVNEQSLEAVAYYHNLMDKLETLVESEEEDE